MAVDWACTVAVALAWAIVVAASTAEAVPVAARARLVAWVCAVAVACALLMATWLVTAAEISARLTRRSTAAKTKSALLAVDGFRCGARGCRSRDIMSPLVQACNG